MTSSGAPPAQSPPETRLRRQTAAQDAARRRAAAGAEPAGPSPADPQPARGRRGVGAIGLAAVALCAALGAYAYRSGGTDDVSEATKRQWQQAFEAAPPTLLPVVPPGEVDAAVKSMQLPPADEHRLRDQISNGVTRMVWLSFTDVMYEDDDTVSVESNDFAQTVVTKNKPIKVYLPEPANGIVNVRGVHDGGGGITIAITSGGRPLNLPFMVVKQVVGVPTVPAP